MAHRPGGGAPYAAVSLIYGLTEHPELGPWIRGKLALQHIGLHTEVGAWLDAVYALWLEQPDAKVVSKAHRILVMESAKLRPDRETWGRTPEQQALGVTRLAKGPGMEAPGAPLPEGLRGRRK